MMIGKMTRLNKKTVKMTKIKEIVTMMIMMVDKLKMNERNDAADDD